MSAQAWRDITDADVSEWRPGWKTGVLDNIASTSDIPSRPRRRRNRKAWRTLAFVMVGVALVTVRFL